MDSESPSEPIEVNEPVETAQLAESAETIVVAEEVKVGDAEAAVDIENETAAEAVEGVYGRTPVVGAAGKKFVPVTEHQLPPQFQNVAAKGGAVAALVLGCLSVFGAFVTQWSLFNAVVGLALGLWGLSSSLVRTAIVGMVLCVIGLVLCGVVPAIF